MNEADHGYDSLAGNEVLKDEQFLESLIKGGLICTQC